MQVAAPTGRIYRMSWAFRGFALFFLAFTSVCFVGMLRSILGGTTDPSLVNMLCASMLPIAGLLMTAHAFVSRLTFTSDALKRITLIRERAVTLESIRGRREYVVSGGDPPGATRYVRLELNNGDPPVDLGKTLYKFDEAFWAWFESLPDLDAAEKVLHKDSGFGLV